MKNRFVSIVASLAVILVPAVFAQAGSYDLSWRVLGGGGGTCAGGSLSLSGTIGQPDTGKMSGSNYTLDGGFWGIYAVIQTPGAPLLTITCSGTNVILAWSSSGSSLSRLSSRP